MMLIGLPLGLAAGILGLSTIANIQQTIHLQNIYNNHKSNGLLPQCIKPSSVLSSYLLTTTEGKDASLQLLRARVPSGKKTSEVIRDLKHMKRDELLTLFLCCDAPPSETCVRGEWDGMLLENNGPVLTWVSSFISNSLFGRGRKWNGKSFMGAVSAKPQGSNSSSSSSSSSSSAAAARGTNRFQNNNGANHNDNPSNNPPVHTTPKKKTGGIISYEHQFDYSLKPSLFGKQSIRLNYSKYQSLLSPWKSMRDEVRVLRMPSASGLQDDNGGVILGFGWMAWSGGRLNCSPFCLVQSE